MKIGTKSVFFGAHQFLVHPLLLFIGWWWEYGFGDVHIGFETRKMRQSIYDEIANRGAGPLCMDVQVLTSLLDPRLWLAFFVHDLGYWGKPNMDGPEGESHPEFGARLMQRWFGEPWGAFLLFHSRYYAKKAGESVSPLCYADKRVIVLEPWWLYLPRVWATGELEEFMAVAKKRAEAFTGAADDPLLGWEASAMGSGDTRRWNRAVRSYVDRWIAEHKDGRPDVWTRSRHAA